MKLAQVVVFEPDERLSERLRPLADQRRWRLRQLRQKSAVLNVLQEGPGVLVLWLGRDVGQELRLLERAAWLFPETAVVVVSDSDNSALAGLAWDLGAAFVLVPPWSSEVLPDIVAGLMGDKVTR